MKTLLFFIGLLALMTDCKPEEELTPQPTTISATVVDEARMPLNNIKVVINALSGSYFGGTRQDTIFATIYTDVNGTISYKAAIESKWRTYIIANGFPAYNDSRYEGTVDGIVNVGQVNNITIILRKR